MLTPDAITHTLEQAPHDVKTEGGDLPSLSQEGPADEEGAQTSVLVLPVPWFYPIPNNARRQEAGDAKALKEQYVRPPVTRAVHYWACSWQSK